MVFWARAFQTARRVGPVLLTALAIAACGGTSAQYPQSTLHPKSEFTRMIDDAFMTTVWWALVVFVLVEGALIFAILRYRGKPDDAEPKQVHGNTMLEIIWTAVPALILAMIAVPTVRAIFETYEVPKGQALEIEVIGHQWWWEFRYPEYGVVTANEMHIPTGRVISLRMTAADVLHSFWLPQLAAKRDVFQNRVNTLWFRADSAGYYSGQCTEFCGLQHGKMGFHVAATSPADFDAYITRLRASGAPVPAGSGDPSEPRASADTVTTAALGGTAQTPRRQPPPSGPAQAQGATIFGQYCTGCHTLDATVKTPMIGPNLANIGARRYIGAGTLLNTDENLARWIQDPQRYKQGILMVSMGLTIEQARDVAAYLRTHK